MDPFDWQYCLAFLIQIPRREDQSGPTWVPGTRRVLQFRMNLGLRDGKIAQVPLRFGFFWPALHHCHLNFVSKEHLWSGTDAHSNQLRYKEGLLKACKSVS